MMMKSILVSKKNDICAFALIRVPISLEIQFLLLVYNCVDCNISLHIMSITTFTESLTMALHESEQLLGELSVMIRPHQPLVAEFAKVLKKLEATAIKEIDEIER